MSITFTAWQNSIVNLAPFNSVNDPRFTTDQQNIIDYAELRCYRDLDLLNTFVTQTSVLTAGNRNYNLPSANGTFVVVDYINVITPSSTTNPDQGTRNPLVPVSPDVLNFWYPSSSGSAVPGYFGMVTQTSIVMGPWPDQAYTVEVRGTIRPTPLGSSNVTTILSLYFPDLFIAASMIRVAGLMKDYGQQADDPRMSQSWEAQYGALLTSAKVEEARKKFAGPGWSPKMPEPTATPPRT